MSKIIIANWKMNPASVDEAVQLAKKTDVEGLVICPPFPFLEAVGKILKRAKLGAQDVFWEEKGAYTGEVSAAQLKSLGVSYVIIGHSERRVTVEETDNMIAKKTRIALRSGLTPILCIGETQEAKAAGQREAMIKHQLEIGLELLKTCSDDLIIAYEPVWAISTNAGAEADTPENATKSIEYMKLVFRAFCPGAKPKFVYGGSVNSNNVAGFLKEKNIEGALVGGASLKPEEIKSIMQAAK